MAASMALKSSTTASGHESNGRFPILDVAIPPTDPDLPPTRFPLSASCSIVQSNGGCDELYRSDAIFRDDSGRASNESGEYGTMPIGGRQSVDERLTYANA